MARLPSITSEQLNPDEWHYLDEIVKSRGSVRGPYGMLLHSPKLAARVAATGEFVRFESGFLSNALKEVVILATAREINSQYEFSAHARLAREAGVSEDTIRTIASGAAPEPLSGDEEMLARYTIELLRDRKISDPAFNAVKDRFGPQGTVELTVLIGHYLLVGQVLAAFDVELAPGVTPELPL